MFRGRILHTEESCLELAKVQDRFFGQEKRRVRLVLAAVPLGTGFLLGPATTVGALFIVFACFFYYQTSFLYEREARKAFEKTPECYRWVDYTFGENGLEASAGGAVRLIPYGSFYALISGEHYLFLFINRGQAYGVDLDLVLPEKPEELLEFLEEKTGLPVQRWEKKKGRD